MTSKTLYRGDFNWGQESYRLWTHAKSLDLAWCNFTSQLTKNLHQPKSQVRMRFSGEIDNYHIQVERRKGSEETKEEEAA